MISIVTDGFWAPRRVVQLINYGGGPAVEKPILSIVPVGAAVAAKEVAPEAAAEGPVDIPLPKVSTGKGAYVSAHKVEPKVFGEED